MDNFPPHVEIASELTSLLTGLSPVTAILLGRLAPGETSELVRLLKRLDSPK